MTFLTFTRRSIFTEKNKPENKSKTRKALWHYHLHLLFHCWPYFQHDNVTGLTQLENPMTSTISSMALNLITTNSSGYSLSFRHWCRLWHFAAYYCDVINAHAHRVQWPVNFNRNSDFKRGGKGKGHGLPGSPCGGFLCYRVCILLMYTHFKYRQLVLILISKV